MSHRDDDDRGFLATLVYHPYTAVTTALGVTGQSLGVVDPFGLLVGLADMVMSTAGTWFPILGAMRHLGGLVGFVPAGLAEQAFVVGAVIYVAYLSLTLADAWLARLKELLKRNKS